jgi:hypothetical protein
MVTNFVSRSVEEATDYNYKVKIENLRISLPFRKLFLVIKKLNFLLLKILVLT